MAQDLGSNLQLRLPVDYARQDQTSPYIDIPAAWTYQPHVYALARVLAERSGARKIFDIGCGNALKLDAFGRDYELIGVDYANVIELAKSMTQNARFIAADLSQGLEGLVEENFDESIVICSDVVEHLADPRPLLRALAAISARCPYVLLSTPDRVKARGCLDNGPPANPAHVMEWSDDEFARLIRDCGCSKGFFIGHTINTDHHWAKTTTLVLAGREAETPAARRKVKVAAIIHVYNERDMIGEVIDHLLRQGIEVHVFDNWSTDGTFEVLSQRADIQLFRFPEAPSDFYDWHRQLRKTTEYARRIDAEWIIHNDADEIRLSPWRDVTLREAISRVDELGYNAIDFTVIDFRFLKDQAAAEGDYQAQLNFFEFGRRPGHFSQIKGWKNVGGEVNLAESGGHDATFAGRRVFPLKFLLKHYPLRSKAQAERKIGKDRLPRFGQERQMRGWHTHYDVFKDRPEVEGWSRHRLIAWHNVLFFSDYLVERLSGIGIRE